MKAKRIFVVVAYDITSNKRRKKVADLLAEYGTRINLSVFECMLTKARFVRLQDKVLDLIDESTDSVAYYTICMECFTRIIYQPERTRDTRLVIVG